MAQCKISVVTPTIRGQAALQPNKESLFTQNFPIEEWEWIVEEGDGKTHDLNAAFNRMLKKAKGELVVFMEDWTKATPEGLRKFWEAYQSSPNTFWTAPLGKVDDIALSPGTQIDWDWRAHADVKEMPYNDWEIDWGCAPRQALLDVGGFDEELDKYWAFDNVSVAYRAYLKGYKFGNLFDNPAIAYNHNKFVPHPFKNNFNPQASNERIKGTRELIWQK